MVALVEPPMALCTMMALRKAAGVMILETVMFFSTSSMIFRPAYRAYCRMSRMVAGTSAAPGRVMPRASAMHCMVEAVPRKVQAPTEGQPVSL